MRWWGGIFHEKITEHSAIKNARNRWKKAAQQRRELAKHLDTCSARMKALNLAWFDMVDFLEELTESEAPKSAEAQLLSNIAEAERATAESLMQCRKAVEAKLEQVASALEAKDKALAVAKSEYKEAKSELLKRRREGLSGEVSTVALDAAGEVLVAGLDRVRKERLLAMLSALHTGFEAHRLHLEDSCEAIRNARPSVVAAATQLSFEEPRIPGRMKIGLPTDVRHVSGAGGPRMLRVSLEAPPALEGDILRHAFPTVSPSPAARRGAALRSPPPLPPRPPLSVMSQGARPVQQTRPPAEGTGEAAESDDEEWATPDSRRSVRLAGAGGGAWGIGYERGWGVDSDSDSGGEDALGEVGATRDGGEPGGQRVESPDRATPPPDRPPAFAVHMFHAGWRPPPPLLEAPPGTSRWSCGTGSPQAPSWREEGKSKGYEEEGCAGGGEWMVVDAESVGDRKGDGDRTGVNPREMTPPVGEGRPGSTLVARSVGEATHAWAEPVATEKAPRAGAAGQSGAGARAEEYEVAGDFEVGGDWVGYRDDHGQPYYYHTRTGHTQWDRPAEFPEAPPDSVRML